MSESTRKSALYEEQCIYSAWAKALSKGSARSSSWYAHQALYHAATSLLHKTDVALRQACGRAHYPGKN